MRAAILKQFNTPLVIEEVPDPLPEPGWVLVRVRACGLCGTDLKIASGVLPFVHTPLIPGHEIAGEISKVGKGVTNVAPGDRVAVYNYITCGQCSACLQGWDALCSNLAGFVGFTVNGGFAELVKVPANNVFLIPNQISFEEAAILSDAVATPYHALLKRAQAQAGQTVAILGVGGLGLHAVQIAKVMGLRVLAVDVEQAHLELAAKLGAEVVINCAKQSLAEAIASETSGRGVDVVLEMSGNAQAATDGLSLLATRGKMILIGYSPVHPLKVFAQAMVFKELEIHACRASTRQDLVEVIEWVSTGKIKPLIHGVMPLLEINQAYEKIKSSQVIGRLVLQPVG